MVRNTTTTETYYNVNGVIQYVSTLSPNTNIYPFAKTIVYETDFIVDDVKTVIESYVSSFITNIVNYNESGNIIENIYENEVLIQQTEYTELTTIDRHYVDGVLAYEKTTLPKDKTFPYTETLIYTDAFVVDDVRTEIKTYNSWVKLKFPYNQIMKSYILFDSCKIFHPHQIKCCHKLYFFYFSLKKNILL